MILAQAASDAGAFWAALTAAFAAIGGLTTSIVYIVTLKGDIRVEKEKGVGRDARLKKHDDTVASINGELSDLKTGMAVLLERTDPNNGSGVWRRPDGA